MLKITCVVCFHFNPQLQLTPRGTNSVSLDKQLVKQLYSSHSVFLVQIVRCTEAILKPQPENMLYTQLQPVLKEYHVPWTEK